MFANETTFAFLGTHLWPLSVYSRVLVLLFNTPLVRKTGDTFLRKLQIKLKNTFTSLFASMFYKSRGKRFLLP